MSDSEPRDEAASEDAREALRAFHAGVDRDAGALAERLAPRLQCAKGCATCCHDDLSVFAVEAARIRAANASLLEDATPHPPGACAFLDTEGACRIYADRPYICRTQGLPFRLFEEQPTGQIAERRDICPINAPGPPIETLPDEACWLIGPNEAELQRIAASFDPDLGRVPLRALFGPKKGNNYT